MTHTEAAMCLVLSEGRGPTLQSSCSLDALSDLKLQRLEAELEGARHQAEGACQREKELRAKLQRLQQDVDQLQDAQRQVGLMPKRLNVYTTEPLSTAGLQAIFTDNGNS